ncbi:hypothetical protein EV702DRAFT_643674 [Suillus placidus]|uniref:Uncharacterized protein n=1 Tax=Suillus placidus TaxID=48579 RepID=A0A9P7A2A5_9AGAM|nr:hypothetical protein EV702DRAFT_643674 [Suillus placidus]
MLSPRNLFWLWAFIQFGSLRTILPVYRLPQLIINMLEERKYLGLVVLRRCDNVAMCNRIMVDQDLTGLRLMAGCVRTAKIHQLQVSTNMPENRHNG